MVSDDPATSMIMLEHIWSYLVFGILILYCLCLLIITVYCLMQFHLLYYYRTRKGDYLAGLGMSDLTTFPLVTIQLPIYNERYVIKRLLEAVTSFDYPKDLMEIHILDDSTDDTTEIIAKEVEKYRHYGFAIEHIRRRDRSGYKAGALKSATPDAKGEYIAIFDADFLPAPDFLQRTLHHFKDKNVGIVQTRWDHLNQNYSLLTKVQALQLNVHFTVEQLGRTAGDLLSQFNGTAGIWRKKTIHDAGGWEADTLTEDLDLSYRAQLKGWKVVYLEDVVSPAELPSEINGLRSQQYRWMKGGAETAKKVLPRVWSSSLTIRQKLHATMHLLGSSIFIAVFCLGTFSVPLALSMGRLGVDLSFLVVFLISLPAIVSVYFVANVQVAWPKDLWWRRISKFLFLFPIFLAMSMALSLHNSIAVIQGYLGASSPFVRTPKFDITRIGQHISEKVYFHRGWSKISVLEGVFMLYFGGAALWTYFYGDTSFLIMHILLCMGYGMLFYFSLRSVFSS